MRESPTSSAVCLFLVTLSFTVLRSIVIIYLLNSPGRTRHCASPPGTEALNRKVYPEGSLPFLSNLVVEKQLYSCIIYNRKLRVFFYDIYLGGAPRLRPHAARRPIGRSSTLVVRQPFPSASLTKDSNLLFANLYDSSSRFRFLESLVPTFL